MITTTFDRDKFFAAIKSPLFGGKFAQQQVDGIDFKLGQWEAHHAEKDVRWLAYALATSYHETSKAMWPIEEYGKGKGKKYGTPDPQTGQTYYGRGDVQLTWKDNYEKATVELGLSGNNDLMWHAERALDPKISADVMYLGMIEGWFRSGNTLAKYFGTSSDPFGAREIINGDKNTVPSWSNGKKIGDLIAGYYKSFYYALKDAAIATPAPEPAPPTPTTSPITVNIEAPKGTTIVVNDITLTF